MHGVLKTGLLDNVVGVRHIDSPGWPGCSGDGDFLIRHFHGSLRDARNISVLLQFDILWNDGKFLRRMQFLDLTPVDGDRAQHIALELDRRAVRLFEVPHQALAIGQQQDVRLRFCGLSG